METISPYIPRPDYNQQVAPFIGQPLIKVFTGQRRVGKSCVMRQIADEVVRRTPNAHLLYIDKEQMRFDTVRDAQSLYNYVIEQLAPAVPNCLFIDEVQEIRDFHTALRSLLNEGLCDIYCTGSNAQMLSSELATLLAGRYVEIHVHALSYGEFLLFHRWEDSDASFVRYLTLGSMPYLHHLPDDEGVVYEYLRNVYGSILLKDVIARESIRNVHFLESLVQFLSDNLGSITSAHNISRYLKSQHIQLSPQSALNYIRALQSAYFVYKVQRAEVTGLKIFEVGDKYYFEDWGLRNALRHFDLRTDVGKLLENVVYIDLLRHGYTVYVGHSGGGREVDFVAERGGERIYLQVAYLLTDEQTAEREFAPLLAIADSYPKYVLSLDALAMGSRQGVRHVPLRQFLLAADKRIV